MAARTATAPGAPTTKLGNAAYELDDRLLVSGWLRRTM
ncbi:MAG: ubiquinol-cytochrome c reductase cytochrome b subunit, partial [Acidimicrobiaceae bacterium]|nr:ubiquinol-cytochrome c reductase cytochrome b subunit [Acidimicrobiaceae bacterium]